MPQELEELRCFTVYVVPLDHGCSQRVCCCDVPHVLSARPLEGLLGSRKLIRTLLPSCPTAVRFEAQLVLPDNYKSQRCLQTSSLAGLGFPTVV